MSLGCTKTGTSSEGTTLKSRLQSKLGEDYVVIDTYQVKENNRYKGLNLERTGELKILRNKRKNPEPITFARVRAALDEIYIDDLGLDPIHEHGDMEFGSPKYGTRFVLNVTAFNERGEPSSENRVNITEFKQKV